MTTLPPDIEKIRDELADKYELSLDRDSNPAHVVQDFEAGFDAGYATAKQEAEELVKSLEYLVDTYPALFTSTGIENATKALAKYRGPT